MSGSRRRAFSAGAIVAGLLAVLTLLRLWWCGRFELSPDEAYYWLWSKHLDWAYFSKGPGVALTIRAATAMLGDTERGVRWLSPLLALGTTSLLWLLVRDALSRSAATATALALQCIPLFSVGALLMTVDPLSIFFWVAALLCGWRGLQRAGWSAWWPLCGLATGLGSLCKYTNALVLLGILLAVALAPAHRRALRDARGLSLVLGFLPCVVPPLLWNAQRGWPTAHHLFERGGLAREGSWFQPKETLEFFIVHFGTWSPIVFAMILLALPAIFRRAGEHDGTRYLLACSAPVLLMYCVLALHEAGEANWTGPGVLTLLPLAVAHWMERWRTSRRVRSWASGGLLAGAMLSLIIANTDLVRAAGFPLKAKQDPSTRLRGWRDTAAAVGELRERFGREVAADAPLVANHYGLASELAFYGGMPSHVPATARPKNQYWFWPGYLDAVPRPDVALFVTDRAADPPEGFAESCEPFAEEAVTGRGGTLRTIRAFACRGLREPAP